MGGQALPYRFQLLLLADVMRGVPPRAMTAAMRAQALRWFWQTTFAEVFTGATGSTIRQQRETLDLSLRSPSRKLPLEGQSVERMDRQKRWGAVRTLARLLVTLEATQHEDARRAEILLGEYGGAVVHKVMPEFDTERPGAHVVASPHELRRLRDSIMATVEGTRHQAALPGLASDLPCLGQFSPDAVDALLAGELARFVDLRDQQLFRAEAAKIQAVGLALIPFDG